MATTTMRTAALPDAAATTCETNDALSASVVAMPAAGEIAVHADSSSDARVERKMKALVHSWGLSRFSEGMAMQWLVRALGRTAPGDTDPLARLRAWVLMQLNGQRYPNSGVSPWQRGCPELIPSLRAQPVWDASAFPFVQQLERAFPAIKQEFLALKGKCGFQPYRAPTWASNLSANDGVGSVGHDAGDWNVFYLFLHNVDFAANRALCPHTVAAIEAIGAQYDHALFSALAPQSHVAPHHGPTNKKLRCHLPLVVPPHEGACRLRVGDRTIDVQEGKCYVFDDSFEHEAWNDDAAHSRIVLIVDVWHPGLSAHERRFFSFLRNAQLRRDKQQRMRDDDDDRDSFFTILQDASAAAAATTNSESQAAIWS